MVLASCPSGGDLRTCLHEASWVLIRGPWLKDLALLTRAHREALEDHVLEHRRQVGLLLAHPPELTAGENVDLGLVGVQSRGGDRCEGPGLHREKVELALKT